MSCRECFSPLIPFPISRGNGCQPLVTVGNTIISLAANTAVSITYRGTTFTGTFIGFDLETGTVVFNDGTNERRLLPSLICTIVPV